MRTAYEPQVTEQAGRFFFSVTISTAIDSSWTSGLAPLEATSYEAATHEATQNTLRLAAILAGKDTHQPAEA